MINMLIVDDEIVMRRGLSFIPWEKAGVCLAGTASSGMEALEIIKQKDIQILFTDIQMPDINGLELIRAANLLNPSIQSVLLTGHNNFNYAKEAISLHVYDYILKPCDPDEVLEIIGKLAKKIEEETQYKQINQDTISEIQKQTLQNTLLQIYTNQNITNHELLTLKDSDFFKSGLYLAAQGICSAGDTGKIESFLKDQDDPCFSFVYFFPANNKFVLLIKSCGSIPDTTERVSAWLCSMQETLLQEHNCTISIGLGKETSSCQEISEAYRTAMESSDLFFSHSETTFISYDSVSGLLNQADSGPVCQKILSQLEQRNYTLIRESLSELTELYRASWNTASKIRLTMIDLCLLASGLVAQKKNEAFSGLKAEQLLSINQADSLSALIDQTLQILTHCIDDLNGTSDTSYHHIVKDCLTYIEAHYTEDISISKAALDIHVNADYLARILKKEYGLPFSQILTNIRLEKACSLLCDMDLSISEVSCRTGFRDFRYFGQVFKTRYKMTPREYRKTVKKKNI
ncbi:response regulator [Blautia producta]|uniref:response regulator n=1 Tax=Blautia producta TaxID=33035 RepID=UPI0031B5B572